MHAPRPAGVILHFDFLKIRWHTHTCVGSEHTETAVKCRASIKVSNRLETEVGTLVSWSSILWDSFGLPV